VTFEGFSPYHMQEKLCATLTQSSLAAIFKISDFFNLIPSNFSSNKNLKNILRLKTSHKWKVWIIAKK